MIPEAAGLSANFFFRERTSIRQQFFIDILDIWIPATNLGYVNLNDGVLGVFGCVVCMDF